MSHDLSALRAAIDMANLAPEAPLLEVLRDSADLDAQDRAAITARAADLVRSIRADAKPGLMEVFLAEYSLSSDEGLALMSMAEAMLRVPDALTADALIADKIAPANWKAHMGKSGSHLVNAASFGLMLTSKVIAPHANVIHGAIKRLGQPVIRAAVAQAMRIMGGQFVRGETIESAMKGAQAEEKLGFTYSYDMLGEAARTHADALHYERSYAMAIAAIAGNCTYGSVGANPGISIKLSAIHPRYEVAQHARVMDELVPRVLKLAQQAKAADMGFNIDAEEADRLQLSLDVIESVLSDDSLAGWDGFGIVVQAYGKRCGATLDYLHALATKLDRKIMVRLVKGAYWDAEIKRAQVEGLEDFPVFTAKQATDVSYIANARKLLGMTDRIYPQFAGHNAHTVSAVLHMVGQMGIRPDQFEFQRLHGMGEALHRKVLAANGTRCRIYAPVGAHEDLLAYLVRRLLENGANSSFVNQIVDEAIAPEDVVRCPFGPITDILPIRRPEALFDGRTNSQGVDLTDGPTLTAFDAARSAFKDSLWHARPTLSAADTPMAEVTDPADGSLVGHVQEASPADVGTAFEAARLWQADVATRAAALNRAADLFEENAAEICALLAREAGKTIPDQIGEIREAVDFLRYYAAEAPKHTAPARGIWGAISPWNFPLAIFIGQIAAALVTGNAVLAKPAPQTPLIAARAVAWLHEAGVPATALQLLPGGVATGTALTKLPLAGVVFTGSTATAKAIRSAMADHMAPGTPLIAETGGLNAMIVDSTALPETAVRDVVNAAFRSAGQRCSALRCLYVQEDIAPKLTKMLEGAMRELTLGHPWQLSTDVGPVIDAQAQTGIAAHIAKARAEGRLIAQLDAPATGTFIAPAVIRVAGIGAIEREIFGPVLHVATFKAADLDRVIADINATGFGLTFGLHTRLQARVKDIAARIQAGNIYVNRNQIGAIVGSQPFGGEGLSGTGPKAGGPLYLTRFGAGQNAPATSATFSTEEDGIALGRRLAEAAQLAIRPDLDAADAFPGPTGELNAMVHVPRLPILCMGPGLEAATAQAAQVATLGGIAVTALGHVPPRMLAKLATLGGAIWWGAADMAAEYEIALSERHGAILPLITTLPDTAHVTTERLVCIDTTAAGGNASLLAGKG